MAKPSKKTTIRSNASGKRRGFGFWRSLLFLVVSILVVVMIALSLWVSIGAMMEKTKISNGINQIIDIVDLSRRMVVNDMTPHEDLLALLARSKQIEAGGNSSDGLRTLVNPWGGTFEAYGVSGNLFRVETVVPSRACVRIIDLLTQNVGSLGLREIDAKGSDQSQRQIYTERSHGTLTNDEVAAGCYSDQFVILDLVFTLR